MAIEADASIERLRQGAQTCKECPLWRHATQTVFGGGDIHAPLMLVGEQPGNEEDMQGLPFVGPAGALLDRALKDAGLDRSAIYLTNAVKHFKWEPRGKRRIQKTPTQKEVEACRRWLIAEIEAVDPTCIVCLGATAGRAVLGHAVRIGALRGAPQVHPAWPQRRVTLTYHPAFVLRQRDPERMAAAYGELVADLTAAARLLIAMR
jgi:DNA polymerase